MKSSSTWISHRRAARVRRRTRCSCTPRSSGTPLTSPGRTTSRSAGGSSSRCSTLHRTFYLTPIFGVRRLARPLAAPRRSLSAARLAPTRPERRRLHPVLARRRAEAVQPFTSPASGRWKCSCHAEEPVRCRCGTAHARSEQHDLLVHEHALCEAGFGEVGVLWRKWHRRRARRGALRMPVYNSRLSGCSSSWRTRARNSAAGAPYRMRWSQVSTTPMRVPGTT